MPYTECDDEVHEIVDRCLKNWHVKRLLLDASKDIDVGCIFYVPKRDDNDNIVGPPLKLHGYSAAAIVKPTSEKQRAQGMADVTIVIDSEQWKDMNEETRIALMDHELEHLERVTKNGEPAEDDLGRPKLKNKLHDWQLGGFRCIAERHHKHALEVLNAMNFADEFGQLLFGFAGKKSGNDAQAANVTTSDGRKITPDEMVKEIDQQFKTSVPVAKAMKGFVSGVGKSFDSIEISSGGESVVIDKAAAARIRKNADAVINDSKKKKRSVA
jgi:hypothetical protein